MEALTLKIQTFLTHLLTVVHFCVFQTLKLIHPATLVVLISGTSFLVSLPLLLYQFKISHTWTYWLIALLSATAYGAGNLFSFKAYKLVDASVVGLVNRLNIVFAAMVGILFLTEIYTFKSYLGLFFVLIVLTGILAASSWIGFLYVLQTGAVSKIFPIYDSLALICTVGAGIIFLKEKQKLLQKTIGTLIVITGVFLLG